MRSWIRRNATAVQAIAVILGAALATVLVLRYVSATGDVGPSRVSIHTQWRVGGDTRIQVPPLGSVQFDTHDVPIAVVARVEAVDPAGAQRYFDRREALARVESDAGDDLRKLVVALAWRALVVAVLAGAVVGLLLTRGSWRFALLGTSVAAATVAVLLVWTWVSYTSEAYRAPQFDGTLEEAPRVLEAVQEQWGSVDEIRGRVETLASQVTQLVELSALPIDPVADASEVRILHVSDIHSNPLGLEIARDLATSFEVDAIVDTGDLTSFGFPLEARIGALIEQMPAPYYLVPGNHDTAANRAALDRYSNLTVVDGAVVDVDGVRLLGVADPAVTANDGDSDQAANAKRDAQAPRVAGLVRRERPTVLAVSTVRQAAESFGDVPVVITGNTHRRSMDIEDSTRVLTVGSTGATGLGSFTVDTSLPYEAEVLRFRAGRLTTVDYVKLKGVAGDYTVARTVIPKPDSSSRSVTTTPVPASAPTSTTGASG